MTASGLDPKAIAAYRAMLRFPDLSDDELADKADIDRSDFKSAVSELKRLGFIATIPFSPVDPTPGKSALAPELALANFAESEWARAARVVADVAAIAASLPALSEDFEAGTRRSKNLVEFEIVLGQDGTARKLLELTSQTRSDYGFVANVQPRDKGLSHHENDREDPWLGLLARGGRVRLVQHSSVARMPEHWLNVQEYLQSGQEVRLATGEMPPMMAIFDMSVAMVTLDVTDSGAGAIIVRSPSIVIVLRQMFEDFWRTCTPADAVAGSRQSEILRLLHSGAKDEAIGRALGVGLRTIRREIADLMDEYGADSRFQLGSLVERRKWSS